MTVQLQEEIERRQRSESLRTRFTAVYNESLWGAFESRSGAGSVRRSPWVVMACDAINKAVREHHLHSIHDIPCGDFNWMPDLLQTLEGVRYAGFDIVEAVISRNSEHHPRYEFKVLDITSEIPPAADLIFCKDLLNHLTESDVNHAIRNMRRSGSKYLLASNNPGHTNSPLPESPDGSRHLDITAAPFHYPPPLWTLWDYLSLWRLEDLVGPGN